MSIDQLQCMPTSTLATGVTKPTDCTLVLPTKVVTWRQTLETDLEMGLRVSVLMYHVW